MQARGDNHVSSLAPYIEPGKETCPVLHLRIVFEVVVAAPTGDDYVGIRHRAVLSLILLEAPQSFLAIYVENIEAGDASGGNTDSSLRMVCPPLLNLRLILRCVLEPTGDHWNFSEQR